MIHYMLSSKNNSKLGISVFHETRKKMVPLSGVSSTLKIVSTNYKITTFHPLCLKRFTNVNFKMAAECTGNIQCSLRSPSQLPNSVSSVPSKFSRTTVRIRGPGVPVLIPCLDGNWRGPGPAAAPGGCLIRAHVTSGEAQGPTRAPGRVRIWDLLTQLWREEATGNGSGGSQRGGRPYLSLFFLPLEELLVDPVRFRLPLESP